VVKFGPAGTGAVLTTDEGFRIKAKKVVFATGYETAQFLKRKVVKLKSTYAIVSEPIQEFVGWGYDRCVIWETARPYFYLRTTRDGRMMMGGEDEDFVNPTRRDRLIAGKARALLRKAKKMFPHIDIEIAYAWAGTFGETEDSLPYIGEVEEFPNAYFALCYGADGTNFALMAAEIIRDLYLQKPNPDAELFRFDR
jgi:glycine/D-amino acid oxidase-like deaminating enzyme